MAPDIGERAPLFSAVNKLATSEGPEALTTRYFCRSRPIAA